MLPINTRVVALACSLFLVSCGSDSPNAPSGGSPAGDAPTPAPITTPAPGPGPVATPTPIPPNGTPSGNFALTPAPVDGAVDLVPGSMLRISAARFEDADADDLKLVVDWGNGTTAHIGCGPCRLEHLYDVEGSFDVVATVTDRRQDGVLATADVTERFTVRVRFATTPLVTGFTATPGNVVLGGSSTLAWTTENVVFVLIDQGLGQQRRTGSVVVTPSATTTYTLRAFDADGQEATAGVTVAIDAPVVGTFTATPTSVDIGQSSTLAWTGITGATACSIDNGVGNVSCADGNTSVSPSTPTTYTLTATGPSGSDTATASVAINPASITSFTATPGNIDVGGSSTLAWSGITNATSCSIDIGVGTVSCAGGNTSVSPASATTYTLTATGPGGTDTATASVSINPPVIGSFTGTSNLNVGESSTLAWSGITNATSCSIDNAVGTVSCAGGTTSVSPTSNTTYTLTATGPGGTEIDFAPVSFRSPSAGNLTASPTTIDRGAGETSTLTWAASTNATGCSIDQGVGSVSCAGGSTSVGPASTTTYTLTATGPGGTATDAAIVTVQYCHSISAGASECPSGATQWCQAEPIIGSNTGHGLAACEACRGSACETATCSGGPEGLFQIGIQIPGSVAFVWDDAAWTDCSSSLTFKAGDIVDAGRATVGRWAP